MRGRTLAVFAIVGAALVVSGTVTAQAGLSVSRHTTFGTGAGEPNPADLSGPTEIIGSGQPADVSLTASSSSFLAPSFSQSSTSNRRGIAIDTDNYVQRISIALGDGVSGATTAYVTDSSGSVIDSTALSNGAASMNVSLAPNTRYHIVVDAGGSSYTSVVDPDNNYPNDNLGYTIVGGVDGGTVDSNLYNIESVNVYTGASTSSGSYTSATHSVSNAEYGFANVTLTNASADITWEFNDGSGWTAAASQTVSSSGNHTIDLSGNEGDAWRTVINFANESGVETQARLHDEGVVHAVQSPDVNNVAPGDGESLDQQNPDLEVQLNDSDFGDSHGDSVQIEWFVDGTSVHSQTVTSNGTYSYTVSGGFGAGTHDWHAEATDDYGLTDSSNTWTFESPGTLYIYNETDPDQLIDNQGEIEVSFYGNNSVITRTTTDGTVDLSGLPANETLVVTANVDGYEARRIVIESLFEQQNIYLLNENVTAVTPTYTLDDNTGNFPPSETTLLIRLPITKDFDGDGTEETQYETVLGDQFGAVNEFSATLRPGIRYQLVVFNQDGDRRALGSHTVDDSSLVSVPIGQIRETPSAGEQTVFTAGVTTRETQSGPQRYVELTYVDPTHSTSSLQYEVVRADNESNVLIANQTESGPLGTFRLNEPIPASEPSNASYIVRYHADRDGTNDVGGNRTIGSIGEIDDTIPVDGRVLELIGFVAIVAVAGLVGIYDDALGAVSATATGIGLTWLGIVHIPSVGLAWAGVTSVVYVIVRRY